jgi:hypothetical protein
MSFRRYEFVCPKCECCYLLASPNVASCFDPKCGAKYLQLLSVLQVAENAGVFNGYPIRIKIGKYLTDC